MPNRYHPTHSSLLLDLLNFAPRYRLLKLKAALLSQRVVERELPAQLA